MKVVRVLPDMQLLNPGDDSHVVTDHNGNVVVTLGMHAFLATLTALNASQLGTPTFNAPAFYGAKARIKAARREGSALILFSDEEHAPLARAAACGMGLNAIGQYSLEDHLTEILNPSATETEALARNPKPAESKEAV